MPITPDKPLPGKRSRTHPNPSSEIWRFPNARRHDLQSSTAHRPKRPKTILFLNST